MMDALPVFIGLDDLGWELPVPWASHATQAEWWYYSGNHYKANLHADPALFVHGPV